LNDQEKKIMILADCSTKVEGDERFGPAYSGKPNFDYYIVKCPKDCNKEGSVAAFGYGIHP